MINERLEKTITPCTSGILARVAVKKVRLHAFIKSCLALSCFVEQLNDIYSAIRFAVSNHSSTILYFIFISRIIATGAASRIANRQSVMATTAVTIIRNNAPLGTFFRSDWMYFLQFIHCVLSFRRAGNAVPHDGQLPNQMLIQQNTS